MKNSIHPDHLKDLKISLAILAGGFFGLFFGIYFSRDADLLVERYPVATGLLVTVGLLIISYLCFRKTTYWKENISNLIRWKKKN